MKRIPISKPPRSEWTKLKKQERTVETQLEAARAPLYMLEHALDYVMSYLIERLNSDDRAGEDVADANTWYGYKEAVDHASKLVEAGLQQATKSGAMLEEARQIGLRFREVAIPAGELAKRKVWRRDRERDVARLARGKTARHG